MTVPELWSYRNCCCQCPLHVHLSKCGVNGSVHWYAQEASTGKIKKNSGEPERIASSRLTLHNYIILLKLPSSSLKGASMKNLGIVWIVGHGRPMSGLFVFTACEVVCEATERQMHRPWTAACHPALEDLWQKMSKIYWVVLGPSPLLDSQDS